MKQVLIHRHPDCARCARIARIHRACDWLDRIESTTSTPPGGSLVPGQIVVFDLVRDRRMRGAEAFALICRQVPLYWPLLMLLWIPAVRRRIARGIDRDASQDCAAAGHVAHPMS